MSYSSEAVMRLDCQIPGFSVKPPNL